MGRRKGEKKAFWRWAALGLLTATIPACSQNAPEQETNDVATANAILVEAFEAYVAKDYATARTKCEESLASAETEAARNLLEKCEAASEGAAGVALDEWTKTYEPGTLKSVEAGGITYNFRYCPAGTFAMGSPEDEEGRGGREGKEKGELLERQRDVTLSKFWILETETTVGMWRSFVEATNYRMGAGRDGLGMYGVTEDGSMLLDAKYGWDNPGYPQTEEHPVVGVDWPGAVAFCEWLAKETGLPVRLPTEAEWEYACRAGTTTAYSFGDDPTALTEYGNVYDDKSPAPLFVTAGSESTSADLKEDRYRFPAPTKKFKPNAWNIYDMHGNVTEWCFDFFELYDADAQTDPIGGFGGLRVLRGGAWNKLPADCRSAMRFYGLPENTSVSNGFRVVIGRKIKADAASSAEE